MQTSHATWSIIAAKTDVESRSKSSGNWRATCEHSKNTWFDDGDFHKRREGESRCVNLVSTSAGTVGYLADGNICRWTRILVRSLFHLQGFLKHLPFFWRKIFQRRLQPRQLYQFTTNADLATFLEIRAKISETVFVRFSSCWRWRYRQSTERANVVSKRDPSCQTVVSPFWNHWIESTECTCRFHTWHKCGQKQYVAGTPSRIFASPLLHQKMQGRKPFYFSWSANTQKSACYKHTNKWKNEVVWRWQIAQKILLITTGNGLD